MTASPKSPSGRRAHLGAPVIPINASATYLRHRAAAQEADLARRKVIWRCRVAFAVILCLLYFAIGRDLLALAKAKRDTAAMAIRHDTEQLTNDLKQIAQSARAASDQTAARAAPGPTAASAEKAGPQQLPSLVAQQPARALSHTE